MTLSTINDLHCGAIRSGGTTPKTAWALRQFILQKARSLFGRIETDLMILGDLLDTFSIPYFDLLEVYDMLQEWLSSNPDSTLYLVPGNHDLSKTTSTISSFQFLCELLSMRSQVVILSQPGMVPGHNAYVIPHVVNQDVFNIEIEKVPEVDTLYLHCNYNNQFAQKADHSLNLSMEQAMKLPVKHIVFAHEHQQRTAMNGKVVVIGNQIPSSVADCIGNDSKRYISVNEKGAISSHTFWEHTEPGAAFARVDWHDCSKAPVDAQFIRVEGDAAASEGSAVVSAISKLRSTHSAFVVTNAVKIEGHQFTEAGQSLEKAQTYDVRQALLKRLTPAQQEVVKQLLAEHGEQA